MDDRDNPWSTGRFANVDTTTIETREDLAVLIREMVDDLRAHPRDWENAELERYLSTLSTCCRDIAGGYRNQGLTVPEQPTWRFVAELLVMATGYE